MEKSELLQYYSAVRTTIQNADSLQLRAAGASLTTSGAFLGLSLTVVAYTSRNQLDPVVGLVSALILATASLLCIEYYSEKVKLFDNFIKSGVEIAKVLESQIGLSDTVRLTDRFEQFQDAGARDERRFLFLIRIMSWLSGGAVLVVAGFLFLEIMARAPAIDWLITQTQDALGR